MISGAGRTPLDRQPVDELAVGQPVLALDRALLEERDHRVGAAEGEQPGLQPLEEDLRRERERDRAGDDRDERRRAEREGVGRAAASARAFVHSS